MLLNISLENFSLDVFAYQIVVRRLQIKCDIEMARQERYITVNNLVKRDKQTMKFLSERRIGGQNLFMKKS